MKKIIATLLMLTIMLSSLPAALADNNFGVHTYGGIGVKPSVTVTSVPFCKTADADGKFRSVKAIHFDSPGLLAFLRGAVFVDATYCAGLFKDAKLTEPLSTISAGDIELCVYPNYYTCIIPAAGTYYYGSTATKDTYNQKVIKFISEFYPAVNRTSESAPALKEGTGYLLSSNAYKEPAYCKFKASKTGYLLLQCDRLDGSVTLCNSKKKPTSSTITHYGNGWGDGDNALYSVQKGKTYYFKFDSNEYEYNRNMEYYVRYKIKSVSEKSHAKKSTATAIKFKKTAKGIITGGSKNADWYKIKVTEKTNPVNLRVYGYNVNNFKLTVYNSKNKKVSTKLVPLEYDPDLYPAELNMFTPTSSPLAPGTYYIKISNKSTETSGYYELSWNKKQR